MVKLPYARRSQVVSLAPDVRRGQRPRHRTIGPGGPPAGQRIEDPQALPGTVDEGRGVGEVGRDWSSRRRAGGRGGGRVRSAAGRVAAGTTRRRRGRHGPWRGRRPASPGSPRGQQVGASNGGRGQERADRRTPTLTPPPPLIAPTAGSSTAAHGPMRRRNRRVKRMSGMEASTTRMRARPGPRPGQAGTRLRPGSASSAATYWTAGRRGLVQDSTSRSARQPSDGGDRSRRPQKQRQSPVAHAGERGQNPAAREG